MIRYLKRLKPSTFVCVKAFPTYGGIGMSVPSLYRESRLSDMIGTSKGSGRKNGPSLLTIGRGPTTTPIVYRGTISVRTRVGVCIYVHTQRYVGLRPAIWIVAGKRTCKEQAYREFCKTDFVF